MGAFSQGTGTGLFQMPEQGVSRLIALLNEEEWSKQVTQIVDAEDKTIDQDQKKDLLSEYKKLVDRVVPSEKAASCKLFTAIAAALEKIEPKRNEKMSPTVNSSRWCCGLVR